MATNWNTILSNTKNLNDVLAILRKILSQTDKFSELDIDGILANIDLKVQESINKFNSSQDDLIEELNKVIAIAEAAGAGANGWTDSLISTGILDAITQHALNQKTVTTVDSIADLSSLQKWDGRTVVTLSNKVGLFKYDSSQASVNNGFSIINGWVRLITSDNDPVPISWFVSENADISDILPLGLDFNIDINCYISKTVELTTDYQTITGNAVFTATGEQATINMKGSFQNFKVKRFISNGALYCFHEEGYNNRIHNIKFEGDVGHYVISSGTMIDVDNCHQADGTQTIPFCFAGATDFVIQNCTLKDYKGFGMQARWCTRGKMKNNRSYSKITKYQLPTTASNRTYVFTADKQHVRDAVTLTDSTGKEITVKYSVVKEGNIYTITLVDSSVDNGILNLHLIDSLETYQINSGCVGVEIIDNVSDGTGDSNVVVGADWHNSDGKGAWVLDPDNVTESDYPSFSVIHGNTAKNAFYANVAVNNSQKHISIKGNKTGNAGMCYDDRQAHNSNIMCPFDGEVSGNTFDNDGYTLSQVAAYKGQMQSYSENRAGLYIDNAQFTDFNTNDPRNPDQKALLLGAGTEADIKRCGIDLVGSTWSMVKADLQKIFETVFVNDMPVNTSDWVFSNANGFLYTDSSDRVSGANSVLINSDSVTIDISAKDQLKSELSNKLVKVRGWFKGTGYLRIFPLFPGSLGSSVNIPINSSSWVKQEIIFPTAQLNTFILRMSGGAFKMQNLEILYKEVP